MILDYIDPQRSEDEALKVGSPPPKRRRAVSRSALSALGLVSMVALAAGLTTGCKAGQQVQILANNNEVWEAPLGTNALYLDNNLTVDQYTHPPYRLQLQVKASPSNPVELVAFPFDAETVFDSPKEGCWPPPPSPFHLSCSVPLAPSVPKQRAVAWFYNTPGLSKTYDVGGNFNQLNGGAQAIKSLYMRRIGACEFVEPWKTVLDTVVHQVQEQQYYHEIEGHAFDVYFYNALAASYLRQTTTSQGIFLGQGGFRIYMNGQVEWTSDFNNKFLSNVLFWAGAAYDARLTSTGLPVLVRQWARDYENCTGSFIEGKCLSQKVGGYFAPQLETDLPDMLNSTLSQCLSTTITDLKGNAVSCREPQDCASSSIAKALGVAAETQATRQGDGPIHAAKFDAALTNPQNWTCGPTSSACVALTGAAGAAPSDGSVCQLKLRAVDLVAMPDSLGLVWYEGGNGSANPTGAEALYLALIGLENPPFNQNELDKINKLCNNRPPVRLDTPISHQFVMVKNPPCPQCGL